MRKSGQGSADMWTYCTTTKFCKLRKSCTVPAKAVYYCDVLCKAYPDIDGKFAAFMTATQQSDSEVALTGSAGAEDSAATGNRKNKQLDTLCSAIVQATTNMSDTSAAKREASEERAEMEAEKARLDTEERTWNQYTSISDRFLTLLEDPSKISLARNMAVRIRKLEKTLGLDGPFSVTKELNKKLREYGIALNPAELEVTVVETSVASEPTHQTN
ncbi:unknown protein [Seminavis robusta]|uniref:Uncharacterized protein n=1 Tax=Seminavis robusta TaxID=568900 RepID=A0A9N8H6H3_9STRA|nr:unknown protein [Seminavis robusta]|eukprot:Sro100_g051200.1 n/a (216) ;mRNA; f:37876-38523